jgi:hypothetical protein
MNRLLQLQLLVLELGLEEALQLQEQVLAAQERGVLLGVQRFVELELAEGRMVNPMPH